jgi:hypothetical protein
LYCARSEREKTSRTKRRTFFMMNIESLKPNAWLMVYGVRSMVFWSLIYDLP